MLIDIPAIMLIEYVTSPFNSLDLKDSPKMFYYIPYSREQKHVSISETPMLLIEINSISNMGRQK